MTPEVADRILRAAIEEYIIARHTDEATQAQYEMAFWRCVDAIADVFADAD
jgi:hypothetical protein